LGVRVAVAQGLPTEPISLANGKLVLGGEATATIAPEDLGYFNYSDYGYDSLRSFRFAVSAKFTASDRVQVLADLRMERGEAFGTSAVYLRFRPWPSRQFDIQAGRVPPTFGATTRVVYGSDNVVIGRPLAYQYLLSLHRDAIPATVDELLTMRGRGWLSNFKVGNPALDAGLPIVNTAHWDTGVQVHGAYRIVDLTGSVTLGSLSAPRVNDDNNARQYAARVVVQPSTGFKLGISGSNGGWLSRSLEKEVPGGGSSGGRRQCAVGGDAEYSVSRILVRGEVIRSMWSLPFVSPASVNRPLVATSKLIETRLRVMPGLSFALRAERLDFNTLMGATRTDTWEAATARLEAGIDFSVTRNIGLRTSWQRDRRNGGRVQADTLVSGQVVYWF
jgi:hypothetical protein